jgi:ligand-binding sensor domain-containing protein
LARREKDGSWLNPYTVASGLPDDMVNALAPVSDGSLWVGTVGGLTLLDRNGDWHTYRNAGANGGLPDDHVSALALGSDGSLWVSTIHGVAQLDKDGRRLRTYTKTGSTGGPPDASIVRLGLSADGSLWAGTEGYGLARLDKDHHWHTYSKASSDGGLPHDDVDALALGLGGALWIGTRGGLARLDTNGPWQTYTEDSTNGGLPEDGIGASVLGRDGALWVGTSGGVVARRGKDGDWRTYREASIRRPAEHSWGWIHALALGPDSSLWVGTTGGGLVQLDKEGRPQIYRKANTNGDLPHDEVQALAFDSDGALWVGTVGGLARRDKNGSWLPPYTKAKTNGGLPHDEVGALAFDSDGALWVGTGGGLARRGKNDGWLKQPFNEASTNGSLPHNDVLALALDADDALWIGTFGGLARRDRNGSWLLPYTKASTDGGLPDDLVLALALDADGALWVGTGSGLARRDKDGHWETYTQANTNGGLPADTVRALALGPDGLLWVGTSGGLASFKRRSGQTARIVNVIGSKEGEVNKVTQEEQTVAVVAFDSSYLTQPAMFHYLWTLTGPGLLIGPEKTRSSVHRATFDKGDGDYQLRVIAVDRYGNQSEPKDINFRVALPRPNPPLGSSILTTRNVGTAVTGLYFFAIIGLFLATRRSALAFRILSDTVWGKLLAWPFFFLRNFLWAQRWVVEPWFQAVRRSTATDVPFLDPPVSIAAGSRSEGAALLQRLRGSPRLWLHGRSGMGKSSVFASWERAYFADEGAPNLNAAVRRYGFIPIMLPVRDYAAFPMPDANPESWVLEAVRRQLEKYGFATRDIGLIGAMLRVGHIAVALDGTNEADRDRALDAFASQFRKARLLVTSQADTKRLIGDERWELWELPEDISSLRDKLLVKWLGPWKGRALARRIVAEDLSGTIVSGYDLRLLADLVDKADPAHIPLPSDRVTLYRTILARAKGSDGQPLRLDRLKRLAWTMVTQGRRPIVPDDEKMLDAGTLNELARDGLRIVRPVGKEYEFRHDQTRAFLAALWLVEEQPNLAALQSTATEARAFGLNRRDQEELWSFVAPLLASNADLEALWHFANDDPVERGFLLAALQQEADERNVTLVRVAQQR